MHNTKGASFTNVALSCRSQLISLEDSICRLEQGGLHVCRACALDSQCAWQPRFNNCIEALLRYCSVRQRFVSRVSPVVVASIGSLVVLLQFFP